MTDLLDFLADYWYIFYIAFVVLMLIDILKALGEYRLSLHNKKMSKEEKRRIVERIFWDVFGLVIISVIIAMI